MRRRGFGISLALASLGVTAGCLYDFSLGIPVDAGVEAERGPDAGGGTGACLSYLDCQSHDCASALCVDRSRWTCVAYGACVWDGGTCQANLATCTRPGDCCSDDCGSGVCLEGNPAAILPPDAGPNSICVESGSCSSYQDCCSQNCFAGRCAAAPPRSLCTFDTPCVDYTDCCSFECRNGLCTDSTVDPQVPPLE